MSTPEDPILIEMTRRQFLRLSGTALVGLATMGPSCTTDRVVKPNVTPTILNSEPKREETLASLVTRAKRMENEFKNKDLSDKATREQYISLLTDIFPRYYPVDNSREQLLSSVVLVDSRAEFEERYVNLNQAPNLQTHYLKEQATKIPAITADGKIYINTSHEIFQKQETAKNPYFPRDWNPLKTLRLALFHELSHLIVQPAQDTAIFSVVDPRNNITDKEIEGFAIKGLTSKKELVGLYGAIDEATTELLSKYINTDLFGFFLSDYSADSRVTDIMIRLEKLIDSAKISKIEFTYLHKTSNLKGLLLLLAERGGIHPQRISEQDRIVFGLTLFEALMRDNQAILQDYMNSARRFTK